MRLKQWFFPKKLWLRGGIIGVIVCLVLGLFNLFIYFPIINNIYAGMIPSWAFIPPMITGQAFPLLSYYIVPYGWLCKFTTTPTSSCANISEMFGFLGLILILFVAYFTIGAIIGLRIQKRKAK